MIVLTTLIFTQKYLVIFLHVFFWTNSPHFLISCKTILNYLLHLALKNLSSNLKTTSRTHIKVSLKNIKINDIDLIRSTRFVRWTLPPDSWYSALHVFTVSSTPHSMDAPLQRLLGESWHPCQVHPLNTNYELWEVQHFTVIAHSILFWVLCDVSLETLHTP